MKLNILRNLKYNCLRLLRIQKSDHQIAIGFIAGFYFCWFPTFGLGLILSVAFSRLLRGNLIAAVVAGAFGTVLWPFLFYLNYLTGTLIMNVFSSTSRTIEEIVDSPLLDIDYADSAMNFNEIGHMGLNFIEGSIINSLLFSVVFYFILRFTLQKFRRPLLKKLRDT
ncbi:DUF2062 domain-containing protein [Paenibacillus sp. CMAA1364]